jgi:cyclic pyranopterin phosphate synthase
MPQEGQPFINHDKIVTYEELLHLVRIFASLGIRHYKVTGGEPFCRKGAASFLRELTRVDGVDELTVTTNGALAEEYLEALAEIGISAVTFSCDAFTDEIFRRICRVESGMAHVRRAMELAARLGMRVKINTVPLRGYNEDDLVPLARYALEKGFQIRFIELMPVGSGRALEGIPPKDVFALMEKTFGPLHPVAQKMGNGPAVVYGLEGGGGYIGFIAAMTSKFCNTCNRVRLTSTGFFKTCLCHDVGVDLKAAMQNGVGNEELAKIIVAAVKSKPTGHTFSFASPQEESFFMHSIGG